MQACVQDYDDASLGKSYMPRRRATGGGHLTVNCKIDETSKRQKRGDQAARAAGGERKKMRENYDNVKIGSHGIPGIIVHRIDCPRV